MTRVPPQFPWEIPQDGARLVGAALAFGRPVALSQGPQRLNGLPSGSVAERYDALRAAVLVHSAGSSTARRSFEAMEADPVVGGFDGWTSLVIRIGADEDPVVVCRAHAVWEALGPNEYAVHLRMRPRTTRGFLEGRAWLQLGLVGVAVIVVLAGYVQKTWGLAWGWWLPVIIGWPVLVLFAFERRYRRGLRRGGTELPHV